MQRDRKELEFIRRLSYILDSAIPIPGTKIRIGLDPIIGLIPGIGDAITSLISSYIVFAAIKMGVSRWTLFRMVFNILIESLLGIVPLLGDLFDVFWRSNEKNRILLEQSLANPRTKSADALFVIGILIALVLILGSTIWGAIALVQYLFSFFH